MQILDDKCYTPYVNMVEMKRASWLVGERFDFKMGLYDATIFELGNNTLQQYKRKAYLESTYIGKRPWSREMSNKGES